MIFNMVTGAEPQNLVAIKSDTFTGTVTTGSIFSKQIIMTVTFPAPGTYYVFADSIYRTDGGDYNVGTLYYSSATNASYTEYKNQNNQWTRFFRVTVPNSGTMVFQLSFAGSRSGENDAMYYKGWVTVVGPSAVTFSNYS